MDTQVVNPYLDIEPFDFSQLNTSIAKDSVENLQQLSTGLGTKVFRMDQQGIWLGASKFVDAPFSVDMLGGLTASNVSIVGGSININNNFRVNSSAQIIIGNENPPFYGASNPLLYFYNIEGTLVGQMQGNVDIARYFRFEDIALGDTIFYESAIDQTGEVMRVNVDDGLIMNTGKAITLRGTGGHTTPPTHGITLYVDQSGGKDRLMGIFTSGAAQVIATQP